MGSAPNFITQAGTRGEIAAFAHEVNQPLSAIVINASTCLRMLGSAAPNVQGARQAAQRAIRDANRASEVIARLRALFTKKPSPEPVDLNETAREAIEASLSELQRNHVTLQLEFADDMACVMGDRVQLRQVIVNLIRNACDAMSTVEDRPRQLVIRTEVDEEECGLSVQDAGVGFEPEEEARLFEAFYTTKAEGMGIGLSVGRSIVESHHGQLWATLNDGPGATFAFSIPRAYECVRCADNLGDMRVAVANAAWEQFATSSLPAC